MFTKRKSGWPSRKGGFKRRKVSSAATSLRSKGTRSLSTGRAPYWHKTCRTSSVPKGLSPFPDRLRTSLKYSLIVSAAHTSGAIATVTLRGNDLFDPSGSIGSTQVYYFDQLGALYYNFVVHASTCKVHSIVVTSANPVEYALTATADATAASSVRILKQHPFAKTGLSGSGVVPNNPQTVKPSKDMYELATSYGTDKIMGLPPNGHLYDLIYAGNYGAAPSSLWYWQYASQPVDGSTTVAETMMFELHYDVTFFNLFVAAV